MRVFDHIPDYNYDIFVDATDYLLSFPERGKTILIGGLLLNFGTALIFPAFFVMGFITEVIQHIDKKGEAGERADSLPKFEEWPELLTKGIRAYAIWLIYTILAFVGVTPFVESREQTWEALFTIISVFSGGTLVPLLVSLRELIPGGITQAAFSPLGLTGLVFNPEFGLFLVVMYVGPAGFINFCSKGTFSAGFDLDAIRQTIRSPSYGVRWLLFMGLWFVSSLLLFAPSAPIQNTFTAYGLSTVGWILAEIFETVVSFVSFSLLTLGFVLIGFADTDARPRVLETILRFRYLPGNRLARREEEYTELAKTYIIGGLVLGLGSLVGTILVGGYLVRVLRWSPEQNGSLPTFDNVYSLLSDGIRFLFVWGTYSVPVWTVFYLTSFPWQYTDMQFDGIPLIPGSTFTLQSYVNAQTFYSGIIAGSPYTARDLSNVVWQLLTKANLYRLNAPRFEVANRVIITGRLVLVVEAAYWVFATITLYLLPAALLRVTRTKSVVAGFDLPKLFPLLTSPRYLRKWIIAMCYWTTGGALALAWNEWQMAVGRDHYTTLIRVGSFSLTDIPTNFGLMSTATLLFLGLIMFLLVLKGYVHISEIK